MMTKRLAFRSATQTTAKFLIRCHAGCDQERVIATLRSRGLWTENGFRRFTRLASRSVAKRTEPTRDEAKRTEAALTIWQAGNACRRLAG